MADKKLLETFKKILDELIIEYGCKDYDDFFDKYKSDINLEELDKQFFPLVKHLLSISENEDPQFRIFIEKLNTLMKN
jgi:hypothetical protein